MRTGRPKTVNRKPWTTTIDPGVLMMLKEMAAQSGVNPNDELEELIIESYEFWELNKKKEP